MRLINETDFSILDIQCRGSSSWKIRRQHSGVDKIDLTIESRHYLTARLGSVSNDEPGHTESLEEPLNLCSAFGVVPLRVPAKPQRTALVDAQPGSVTEQCFERVGILAFCFF